MECSTKKDSYILTIDADAVIRNVQKSLEEIIEELNEYSYSNEILTKTIKIKRLEKKTSPIYIFWTEDYHPPITNQLWCISFSK